MEPLSYEVGILFTSSAADWVLPSAFTVITNSVDFLRALADPWGRRAMFSGGYKLPSAAIIVDRRLGTNMEYVRARAESAGVDVYEILPGDIWVDVST